MNQFSRKQILQLIFCSVSLHARPNKIQETWLLTPTADSWEAMKSLLLVLLSTVFSIGRAYLVSPPGAVAPGTTSECSNWVGYNSLWGCENIEVLFGITAAEFEAWVRALYLLRSPTSRSYFLIQIQESDRHRTGWWLFHRSRFILLCPDQLWNRHYHHLF